MSVRFKALDVTSMITVESKAMFSTETVTDRDFSPIADNLLMLRYVREEGSIKPSLTVVKTRGTKHDRDTHLFEIEKGGMRIGPSLNRKPGKT
jgi:circadian clock protein KaiC